MSTNICTTVGSEEEKVFGIPISQYFRSYNEGFCVYCNTTENLHEVDGSSTGSYFSCGCDEEVPVGKWTEDKKEVWDDRNVKCWECSDCNGWEDWGVNCGCYKEEEEIESPQEKIESIKKEIESIKKEIDARPTWEQVKSFCDRTGIAFVHAE
jgi:hypothetical protein